MWRYAAILIVVIVIVIYVTATWNTTTYEDYIRGYWVAESDDFCEDAGVASMMLYVGVPSRDGERDCYMIIMDDICNEAFTMKWRPAWSGISLSKYVVDATISDCSVLPERASVEIDMRDGRMRIVGDSKVYCDLVKQHYITNILR